MRSSKVVLPMVTSPLMASFGFSFMTLLTWLVWRKKLPKINRRFGLQILSAGFMALSHGQRRAEIDGIIALALALAYPGEAFEVPLWVILTCAIAMALGTMSGLAHHPHAGNEDDHAATDPRLRRRNHRFCHHHGRLAFRHSGSTTQVISSSILGVGATKRLSAVRWGIVGNILWAWVLTCANLYVRRRFDACGPRLPVKRVPFYAKVKTGLRMQLPAPA